MGKKVLPALTASYSSPTQTNRVLLDDEKDNTTAKTSSKQIERSQSLHSNDAGPG